MNRKERFKPSLIPSPTHHEADSIKALRLMHLQRGSGFAPTLDPHSRKILTRNDQKKNK